MTLSEKRNEISKKYLGIHGIHSIGISKKEIFVYHLSEMNDATKKLLEKDSLPYSVVWKKEPQPRFC